MILQDSKLIGFRLLGYQIWVITCTCVRSQPGRMRVLEHATKNSFNSPENFTIFLIQRIVLKPIPAILIFDIGKTTKKVVLFDHSFHTLEEQTTVVKEIKDDDGFPADDLPTVSNWVTDVFRTYLDHPRYEITHCNISAYGASLVHLDSEGEFIAPFYNYLKTFPASCYDSFMAKYSASGTLSAETASPYLGLLNSGLQLYWLSQDRPEKFEQIRTSLHLPQYFAYVLTRKLFTDITSVGCHTMLWNFDKNAYHQWANTENLIRFFPPLYPASHVINVNSHGRNITFGIGVHDSSAALMPYLVTQNEPFLLLSTGTWNICFNPSNQEPLTTAELASDCLSYFTYEGKAVKASRIFLGHEHEMQVQALARHFGEPVERYQNVKFDHTLYRGHVGKTPFFPLGMEGTGPIPEKQSQKTDLGQFDNYDTAYHQLARHLVKWQMLSIDLVDPKREIRNIIIVGGFTKSPVFLEILKRECSPRNIFLSDHPRASALGAAWLVAGNSFYKNEGDLLSIQPF